MNIGIVNISYNCVETVEKALSVWKGIPGLNVAISCQHVCFPETYTLNFPILSNDGTIEKLQKLKGNIIDHLTIHPFPVFEQIAWTNNILYFDNLDYLVMVGSDEIWTKEQIIETFKWIEENPVDYYKVNFKNYINYDEYVDDFIVPRIWSMKRRGGVKKFWKDDLVVFNDGCLDSMASWLRIPKSIAFVDHFSWSLPPENFDTYYARNEAFVSRKLQFSAMRYSMCSYAWDTNWHKLVLNEEYYKLRNIPKPIIYKE